MTARYRHFSTDYVEALLVFAARRYFDEPNAKARAWITDGREYVTIEIDGEPVTVEWTGAIFRERPEIERCAECLSEPGRGAWWDEDDRGEPFADGCATCAALLVRRAEEARTDAGVDAMENREVA